VINNAICMIAAGDAVIFGAHPKAVRSTLGAVELVNRSLRESGAPFGLVSALTAVSPESLRALMAHRFVRLIAATGGADAVAAALSAGEARDRCRAGNPPVLVDETARWNRRQGHRRGLLLRQQPALLRREGTPRGPLRGRRAQEAHAAQWAYELADPNRSGGWNRFS
jgi:hypothetical protein